MYELIFYANRQGREPVREYLDILRVKAHNSDGEHARYKKVMTYLSLLEEYGVSIGMPYVKYLGDGVWELRPMRDRIIFAGKIGGKYILLHMFYKKMQKTPKLELDRARRNLKEFAKRNE